MSKKIITLAQLQKYDALLKELLGVELAKKVNKVEGKGLSTEDFTSELKSKLEGLENYNDSELATKIGGAIERIVALEKVDHSHANAEILDKITAEFTVEEKTKLAGLANYNDTEVRGLISGVSGRVDTLEGKVSTWDGAVEKVNKIVVTENSVTDGTATFTKYDDTALAARVKVLEDNPYSLPEDVVRDSDYKHITVTSTSVSDGVNTFEKFVLPEDVVQDAEYSHIVVTEGSVSDGVNTFYKFELPEDVVQDSTYATRMESIDYTLSNLDSTIGNAVAGGVTEAKAYTDEQYDSLGQLLGEQISGVETGAHSYTDEEIAKLSEVYEPKGAESKANYYTDEKISDLANVYEPIGAESKANFYADGLIAAEVERANGAYDAKGSADQALVDAKAYTDELKSTILGDNTKLVDTYDTLEEIGNWISSHEGSTVVELTTAISNEEKARKEADEAIVARVVELEKVDHDHSNKDILDAITVAFTDANYVHTDNNYDAAAVAEVAKVANKADKSYVDDNFVLSADIVYAEEADIVALFAVA